MSLFMNMRLTKRSIPGYYEKGQWKKGKPVDLEFLGTAQPASGKVMELLPEGKRNTETISVFAPKNMEFTSADIVKMTGGDIIIFDGSFYEVLVAKKWKVGLIPHWELVASKVDRGD